MIMKLRHLVWSKKFGSLFSKELSNTFLLGKHFSSQTLFTSHFLVMLGGCICDKRVLHVPRAWKASKEHPMSAAEMSLLMGSLLDF